MKNDLYYVERDRLQQVAAPNAQFFSKLSFFNLNRFHWPSRVIGFQEIYSEGVETLSGSENNMERWDHTKYPVPCYCLCSPNMRF